ncbi:MULTISPECIES: 2-oxoglutarate dehydrogenase, E2 component, dihydrolipoamide succinyltransferase [unclassified Curtobacterium]|uniref:2-oxoglutarate dehydrogenase, E2 component, dihydrolipoamide succinyltransferase n=2 Tax=Curtobacterium TaxID=2034 RepID=UPI0008DE6DB6|nr:MULTISPECIES: 2-oxoglutarate dehydrogenase, E2 component, dihydrolipoamide succinyltransferase [unclassified Curtobacterium]WIA98272.1 2-oxoglutarate dehydrogenase, E2 component, dihydrolipoamide succinyltransferase [Curtobacterium sp. MCBA15_004]WIB01527.1 2-oxoglutarate dehydrogenase, E2 component, dihydrolipoamide succinyltransferase [Curtobacterium sp. MCBA15_012]
MSESVNLPALGESVTEGTVTRWLKNVGDRVEVDEPLLEVSTDKVDTEIPSPIAGVVEEILVQEDETVEVGTALVKIGDGSGSGSSDSGDSGAEQAQGADESAAEASEPETAPSTEQQEEQQAPEPQQAEPAPGGQTQPAAPQAPSAPPVPQAAPVPPPAAVPAAVPAPAPAAAPAASGSAASASVPQPNQDAAASGYVTPLVRKLANEQGVDLSTVTGSGVGGRIRKEDVLAAAEQAKSAAGSSSTAASAPAGPFVAETSPLRGTREKMSRLRKVVAERAVQSMTSTAQLTSVVEVDVTKVAQFRDANKAQFLEKTGSKLSFMPFFALAASEALKAHPKINSTVEGDEIVYPEHENVSIAVDTERGLLTPVIKDASSLDLAQFAKAIADLAERTRNNQLKPDELAGGTFTLTNTGSRGALFDTPVVFLPQSAILGTGIVTKRPAVVKVDGQEAIAIRSFVYLALSYDHRIIDGADASRYLVAVKNRLEEGNFGPNLGY